MDRFTEARLATLDSAQKALELSELSARLISPYLLMAGMLVLLSLFIKFSPLPEPLFEEEGDESATEDGSILQYPQVILGAILCPVSHDGAK